MRDLFGVIPVSWPEIWQWVEDTTGIPRSNWRAAYYAEHWNVAEKIRAEKLKAYKAPR